MMQDKEKVVMGEETSYGPSREAVSYAQATNKAKSNVTRIWRKKQQPYMVVDDWRAWDPNTEIANMEWLIKSLVGKMRNPQKLTIVMERFIIQGFSMIKICLLGDDLVLLSDETNIYQMIQDKQE